MTQLELILICFCCFLVIASVMLTSITLLFVHSNQNLRSAFETLRNQSLERESDLMKMKAEVEEYIKYKETIKQYMKTYLENVDAAPAVKRNDMN